MRDGHARVGLTRFGGYATALNADVRFLRPLREAWSFEEGAAFPVQALTAWYGLVRLARVDRADVVLVHSAAGGVGLNALQILHGLGARAIATVGDPAKVPFLTRAHGARLRDAIIVRDRARFGAQLDAALEAAGAPGLDVVFDAIAGPYFRPAYMRLRPEGRHVIYGAADYMTHGARPNYLRLLPRYLRRPRLDPVQMIAENRSVLAFNLIWLWDADRAPRTRLRRARGSHHQPALRGTDVHLRRGASGDAVAAGRGECREGGGQRDRNAQCTMHNAQKRTGLWIIPMFIMLFHCGILTFSLCIPPRPRQSRRLPISRSSDRNRLMKSRYSDSAPTTA